MCVRAYVLLGLKSYVQPPAFEITAAPLAPYMSAYQKRICKKMKAVAPIAFKLYGDGLKVALSADGRTISVESPKGKTHVPLHESVTVCAHTAAPHSHHCTHSCARMHCGTAALRDCGTAALVGCGGAGCGAWRGVRP